jgi:hypothetical protein
MFEEIGIMNPAIGKLCRTKVLQPGGIKERKGEERRGERRGGGGEREGELMAN